VTIEIKSSIGIKKDAAATIQTNILSGVSFILIEPGKSAELLETRKGDRYPVIRSRRSTLSSLTARGPQLLDKLDEIFDHVEDLLSDQNRQAFTETLDNVRKISKNLADHSDEIATNAADALKAASALFTGLDNSYSSEGGLKDKLSTGLDKASVAFSDFDKLAKGLSDTNRDFGGVVQDLRPGLKNFSQHTLGDVDALVGEVRQFVAGLGRLVSQLERDPTRLLFGDRREGYQPK
jgi:phospholipid/cholesterol/gamma-HCH transport system substrate-binding protein